MKAGVTINRPPRDGMMAFVRSPDKQSIELLQKGAALPPQSPGTRCPTPAIGEHLRARLPEWPRHWPDRRLACRHRKPLYISRPFPRLCAGQRPSSSGPGRRPFTAETRVRFP